MSSVSTVADDTDIFFADDVASEESVANIMFMFDTSGSMNFTEVRAANDNSPRPITPREDTRLYRLKSAMKQVLESIENVNVGIGAFNGKQVGGSIRFPVVGVDEDLCENANCDSVSLLSKINSDEDDAQQSSNGSVELYGDYLFTGEASDLSTPSGASLMALRFTDLNIPRGAEITRAQLRLTSPREGDSDTSIRVFAEKTGNSLALTGANGELTARYANRTDADELWLRGDWDGKDKPGLSPDLSPIVQEITEDGSWCGGNALTMLLTGLNDKEIYTHDYDQWLAPILVVDYDPQSIVVEDTCLRSATTSTVANGNDDVAVDLPTGVTTVTANSLDTKDNGNLQRLGLRFDSVDVPAGADIISAHIELTSTGYTQGTANLTIGAERSASAEPIDSSLAYPFSSSSRTFIGEEVVWSNVPEEDSGTAQQSPDISSLVEQVVNTSGWSDGSSMLFTLTPSAGTGARSFASADSPTLPARLVVKYQQEGDELNGSLPILMTGREQLINNMLVLRPEGSTPFVDYFYEAAQYMLGGPVDFGLVRGGQESGDRYHRVSVASSYSGATGIYRPEGCTDLNPLAEACVDEEIEGNPTYNAPASGECSANHIILLSDGEPTRNSAVGRVESLIGGSCASTIANPGPDDIDYDQCAVELADWLANPDEFDDATDREPVITNTIGMNITSQLLIDVATKGGGEFYPVSSAADISEAFNAIIQSAVSIDSSFVAPSASVSLENRLVNSNDVYFAMFNPGTTTRWDGNLKRYAFAADANSGELKIVDSQDTTILDANGDILDNTRSFWSDVDDGSSVKLGGAASQQTLARNIYVSLPNTGQTATVLSEFNEDNVDITKNLLGIAGATDDYRTSLLKWARGVDIKDYDGDGDYTEVRKQMGDPLHSTQHIFTYAGDNNGDDPQSLIFVGTNEGFLHSIDVADGTEEFAFIPGELLANLDYYYRDNPVDNNSRPYGLDGEITGWHNDINSNGLVDGLDTAYLYVGMRRGGRNYYALDVTDPQSPELLWTINGGGNRDFAELGQSWSRPIKARVKYLGDDREVLFFAAGYDPANDDQDQRERDQYGAGLFMVDASTGERISSRDENDFSAMIYSIPSDLRIIDPDGDGYSNSIFVGDTGGQLWRFDINNEASNDNTFLTGTVLADLGGLATVDNRQFFHEPDVAVISSVPGANFLNIAIGSGTRPDPNSLIVENGFYSIRDSSIFGAPFDTDGALAYPETLQEADLVNVTNTSGSTDTSGNISNGWYFRMPFSGEKVLSTVLTVDNKLFFTSYSPITEIEDICAAQIGAGYVYSLDVVYGDPASGSTDLTDRYTRLVSPGIPPPVTGTITEARPDAVTMFVGFEALEQGDDSEPFKKSFWAEQ